MHLIFVGLLLGWGASLPIGPINLEIVRRNLTYGARFGLAFGSGACLADMTYLLLLCLGALKLLAYPLLLKIIGIVGSMILVWFAYKAFKASAPKSKQRTVPKNIKTSLIEGYILTLLNPYTILFWGSISSQIPAISEQGNYGILLTGIGVTLGTFSWIFALNGALHFTRHKISETTMRVLNMSGGLIVLAFAFYGFYRNLF